MSKVHNNGVYARNVARLGAKLRARRCGASIRIVDLATAAGVDKSTVSRFETGRTTPGLDTVERMITAAELLVWMRTAGHTLRRHGRQAMATQLETVRPLFVVNDAKRPAGLGDLVVQAPVLRLIAAAKLQLRALGA